MPANNLSRFHVNSTNNIVQIIYLIGVCIIIWSLAVMRTRWSLLHVYVTWFLREAFERRDASLAVVSLVGDGRDVRPPEGVDDVEHRLRLVRVGRHDAGEVAEATLVAQLDARRRVADLRNLKYTTGRCHWLDGVRHTAGRRHWLDGVGHTAGRRHWLDGVGHTTGRHHWLDGVGHTAGRRHWLDGVGHTAGRRHWLGGVGRHRV